MKLVFIRQTDWEAFKAAEGAAFSNAFTFEGGLPAGWLAVHFTKETNWQRGKAFGGFVRIPAPYASASRLPVGVTNAMGAAQAGETVGDYFERVLGRDLFSRLDGR